MERFEEHSHRRYNILTGEWVLVSPHRNKRPWRGQTDEPNRVELQQFDPSCYLCPGNQRASGASNPNYEHTFVFENDYAALEKSGDLGTMKDGLLEACHETGICKVVCFSPDHSRSLADMDKPGIERVVLVWQEEYRQLASLPEITHVQIFENKGAIMGCSNPHPHGQIWAQGSIPNEARKRDTNQKAHFAQHTSTLLSDYLQQEMEKQERMVYENDQFAVLIPFWAVWPFETMIIPKTPQAHIGMMQAEQVRAFADAIGRITRCYDKVFDRSFPYSSGIHQAPTDGGAYDHWHWHMNFYPPLLRSASVKKFMVGYEMFAMPQRDLTAETAASILREKIEVI